MFFFFGCLLLRNLGFAVALSAEKRGRNVGGQKGLEKFYNTQTENGI